MTTDIALGMVALAVIALGLLIWFSYRAGKSRASVANAQTATDSANVITEKAEAMAQAQADKPATEDAILARLDGADA